MENYAKHYIKTNGIVLHTVFAGPEDGPPVILLHGFPEYWRGWKHQIPYLAERGYRVIVPDQRGYNLSDKPKGVASYHVDTLARDITGLIDALGYKQVQLVGHDWGAIVAWWLAAYYPNRLKQLVILNVPYPTILSQSIFRGNLEQLRKSWYIFFFQIPKLPEFLVSRDDWGGMKKTMYGSSKKGTFSRDDIAHYQKAWSRPGAMTAMMNWYRAIMRVIFLD